MKGCSQEDSQPISVKGFRNNERGLPITDRPLKNASTFHAYA